MRLRTILPAVLLLAATAGEASAEPEKLTVSHRDGELHIRLGERFRCRFRRCMFNELYTFYETAVGQQLLNRATSDNIGPLAIEGWGWIGANHTHREQGRSRTARHVGMEIEADGLRIDRDTTLQAREVTIRVENLLLDPRTCEAPERPFCREQVTYRVRENNIEVALVLRFLNPEPATVRTYYGMQSMFCGETHTLTPGGTYADWTPQEHVSHFTKGDCPAFQRFVEKNGCGYQSTWLLPEGAGGHTQLGGSDAVFIGNSSGKSYHRMLAAREVRAGDEIRWRGVYTWLAEPLADDGELFCYEAIEGDSRVLFIDCKKACDRRLTLPGRDLRTLRELSRHGAIRIRRTGRHTLRIRAEGPATCTLRTEPFGW